MKPNALWRQVLWQAMTKTGHGYRKHSLKHTGKGKDRRNDKLEGLTAGWSKAFRSHFNKHARTA